MHTRKDTKKVMVGNVQIGHQDKVVIQTMARTKTEHTDEVIREINTYATSGAEIVRVAVFDDADADAIRTVVEGTSVPVVADIHFNHTYALKAAAAGVAKIRINPGNIGDETKVKAVVEACKEKGIPIRIGINAGSLEKDLLERYGHTAEAMVESAKRHVAMLEALDFQDIILSLKASDVRLTIDANLLAAKTFSYPLHIGITEAGPAYQGTIKSAAGLGTLLYHGVGDTIRISLSADRLKELKACKTLLSSFGLYDAPTLISCPTCGRLAYDMDALVKKIEAYLEKHPSNLKIAVMGCAVNGPGEARDADIGVAGGKQSGLLFVNGEIVKKVPQDELYDALIEAIESYQK
ncbi:MAG: flavodoxin-dependent (E)-4-hydroxy-3-methylbut-2-enyl-diphosphate synthase [Bacillota bacterium]